MVLRPRTPLVRTARVGWGAPHRFVCREWFLKTTPRHQYGVKSPTRPYNEGMFGKNQKCLDPPRRPKEAS